MIFISVCNSCLQCYELNLIPSDVDLLKQVEVQPGLCHCPRGCGGLINIREIAEFNHLVEGKPVILDHPIRLNGKQIYEALYGNGLPDEVPTDPLLIDSLLRANAIVGTDVEKVGDSVYLHGVKLANGLTIHLGGGMGPRVVKITKPLKEASNGAPSDR